VIGWFNKNGAINLEERDLPYNVRKVVKHVNVMIQIIIVKIWLDYSFVINLDLNK